ncbi:hypothetical protein BOTNAR_0644g00010 [Botryotinia narcissicola]|uniref:Uncharacterized protein n=1 Tax=Botryotinia narcissicola TaxID=278944 RepID=A0A4Z1HA23_9HELO|nr:hypothetical protein BOTNAR_0644g00010 [Botryotinia narcissicola]
MYSICDVGFNVLEDEVILFMKGRMTQPVHEPTMVFAGSTVIRVVYTLEISERVNSPMFQSVQYSFSITKSGIQ